MWVRRRSHFWCTWEDGDGLTASFGMRAPRQANEIEAPFKNLRMSQLLSMPQRRRFPSKMVGI
jgi:hypothetical protein